MCNYLRFGGVVRDVPEDVMQKIKDLVFDRLAAKTDEMDRLLSENEVLVSRLKGIHVIDGETAIKYSVTGPVLRAAGVPYDLRRADPYSVYDRFEFDVAMRPNGDLFDNYIIRPMRSVSPCGSAASRHRSPQDRSTLRNHSIRSGSRRVKRMGASNRPKVSWRSMSSRTASQIRGAITCVQLPLSTLPASSRCASAPRSQISSRCWVCLTS
jgi:hypothetical protein